MRLQRLVPRTEENYLAWILPLHRAPRRPASLGETEVRSPVHLAGPRTARNRPPALQPIGAGDTLRPQLIHKLDRDD
jgi:hypothetical protein